MYTLLLSLLCPLLENIFGGLAYDGVKRLATKLLPQRTPLHACRSALDVTATYETQELDFLIKEFNPARKVSSYVPYIVRASGPQVQHVTDTVIPMHPCVVVEVTSTVPDQEVQVAPYLVVHILTEEPITGEANCLRPELATGAAGGYNYFGGTLTPEQDRVFGALYAGYSPSKFFTVRLSQPEHFILFLTVMSGYYYTFRIGVVYRCGGQQHTTWLDQTFVTGRPNEANMWTVDTEHDRFRHLGRESMAMDAAERQEVIHRMKQQNRQVQRVPKFTLPQPVAER